MEGATNTTFLADLDSHGKQYVVAIGGAPGKGNGELKNYRKNKVDLKGKEGEERELVSNLFNFI